MNPPAGPELTRAKGRRAKTTAEHAGVDGEHPAAPNNKMNPHGATSPVEGLTLGPGLVLPVEAVTETFAILAKRGAGKTYTAAVLVEEMMGAGLPVVIVDPVGVWWGLRSSADGTAEGLPVVIFGGDHADLPLAETAGGLLADLVVDERVPAVLDLSTLSKSAGRRFMTDFAERLYHRNRDPLHLVLDEADAFAPQRTDPGGQRLLGAIEDLVRRGRARGIGVTLITQRPAVLNKDVLTQAEVLIALRMTGPRDVAAIDEWVRLHAEEDQATEVKRSLPSLPVGTAWVWSPGWLGLLQRVAVRARTTYDSSATPKAGQLRITPTRLAPIDLAALGERITAMADEAAATDPAQLRRRVAQLERELAALRAAPPRFERVEVPVLDPATTDRLEHWAANIRHLCDELGAAATQVSDQLAAARTVATSPAPLPPSPAAPSPRRAQPQPTRTTTANQRPAPRDHAAPDRPQRDESDAVPPLKAGARRMLHTLASHHPVRVTRAQLATLSRFKVTGGTFNSYLSTLRRAGLITEQQGLIELTDAGRTVADVSITAPASTAELLEQWRTALKAGARTMLDLLIDAHPDALTRGELAHRAGYEISGGTFNTYLSTLRRNDLADTTGDTVRANDVLFPAPSTPR